MSAPERLRLSRGRREAASRRAEPALAEPGRLALAFIALGLLWLAAGTGLVALHPELLALPAAAPRLVALTHVWVLGFLVTVAIGASYQVGTVVLGLAAWSRRRGRLHLILHAAGVPGMVVGFWRWQLPLLLGGGVIVGLGVVLFVVNQWRAVLRSRRRDVVAFSLLASATWLGLTVAFGLGMVAILGGGLRGADLPAIVRAHVHLGLVGFFLTLLQGVSFQLVPMFTLGQVPNWRPVRAGLWLSQVGLVGLVPTLAFRWDATAAGFASAIAAGALVSAWSLRQTAATARRSREAGIAAFLFGWLLVPLGAGAGLLFLLPAWGIRALPIGRDGTAYAVTLLVGALAPMMEGMLCRIVPFLTWLSVYAPRVGREPTPVAGSLSHRGIEGWALAIQGLSLGPLVVGTALSNPVLLRAGSIVWAIGTALFLADMVRVLRHFVRREKRVDLPAPVFSAPPREAKTDESDDHA